MLISSLDRETTDQYNISLRVEDSALGSPDVKYSNVTLYISVEDVNDNPPVCSPTLFAEEILEGKNAQGNYHIKLSGMHVVSLRAVNHGFWSQLGCSVRNATIFSRQLKVSLGLFSKK